MDRNDLQSVWREDAFNSLPLDAYLDRLDRFDYVIRDQWYQPWRNDTANSLSFPDYLARLGRVQIPV